MSCREKRCFWSQGGDLPIIFTCDTVTSELTNQFTGDQKLIFHDMPLSYFLHALTGTCTAVVYRGHYLTSYMLLLVHVPLLFTEGLSIVLL